MLGRANNENQRSYEKVRFCNLIFSFKRILPESDSKNYPNKLENLKEEEEETFMKDNEIIVASTKEIQESPYFLRNNPVSFYCLNLPDIMNGNINLWAGGRNRTGLETENGVRIEDPVFKTQPKFNDGKLEFATFDSLLLYILNISNSIAQEGGPFEIDFKNEEEEEVRTFLNIDGEFYKVYNIDKINISKGESLCSNGCLRILINEDNDILK